MLGTFFCDLDWVGITESVVDRVVILADVVVVSFCVTLSESVALFDFFYVLCAQILHVEVDRTRLDGILVETHGGLAPQCIRLF